MFTNLQYSGDTEDKTLHRKVTNFWKKRPMLKFSFAKKNIILSFFTNTKDKTPFLNQPSIVQTRFFPWFQLKLLR